MVNCKEDVDRRMCAAQTQGNRSCVEGDAFPRTSSTLSVESWYLQLSAKERGETKPGMLVIPYSVHHSQAEEGEPFAAHRLR